MPKARSKTVNGKPTPRSALNTEAPRVLVESSGGLLARVARLYRRLNEVMSGMYTGVGCAGTPHSHHSYADKPKDNPKSDNPKPDNSP